MNKSVKKKPMNEFTRNSLNSLLILLVAVLTLIVYKNDDLVKNGQSVESGGIIAHFLDVGQADSVFIQSENGNLLIDGGERASEAFVIEYIKKTGTKSIDYIIATHPHSDHIGGLAGIIRAFDVKEVIMPDAVNTTSAFERLLDAIEEKGIEPIMPEPGARYETGGMEFTIVAPNSEYYDNLNNYSIGLLLSYGETSFLFTGDAEAEAEREILQSGLDIAADVFKAGHHGSSTSNTADFLRAVNPSICVISCGFENEYGHPHREVLNELQKRNIDILRTDIMGTIMIASDGESIRILDENTDS